MVVIFIIDLKVLDLTHAYAFFIVKCVFLLYTFQPSTISISIYFAFI